MKRWAIALAAGLCVGAVALAACGGGGDDGDKTATGTKTSKTTAATSKPGTPGASGTSNAGGTPGAGGTAASGTPAAGGTPGADETPGAVGTPRPVETIVGSGNTPVASDAPVTPNASERSSIGESGEIPEDIIGGDLDAEPEVLNDLPEPPSGATIDPATIAPSNSGAAGAERILDLNASEPGIQTTRSIEVGDVIRVGVVVTGVPSFGGNVGGLAAFNFKINYDYTKIVAPTIINGSGVARNPDLNETALGSGPGGWNCLLPAPQGDADDPGGLPGDGDPATGQAALSCFADNITSYGSGEIVIATIQFQAIASGTVDLSFSEDGSNFYDVKVTELGSCGDVDPVVSCQGATLTIE